MRNKWKHPIDIDLKLLSIKNDERKEFAKRLEEIPYRGYAVEEISDGRKIVIVKPGGKKAAYGDIKKEDFFVYIHDPDEQSFWQISHKQIREDLEAKAAADETATIRILEALNMVYDGEDPDDILKDKTLSYPSGEDPEVIMKVYKWIWGQEDVNYPPPKFEGRAMSWQPLKELLHNLREA